MDTQKGQENQDLRDLIEGDRLNIINFLKAFNLKVKGNQITILFSENLEKPRYKQLWEVDGEPSVVKVEFTLNNIKSKTPRELRQILQLLIDKIVRRDFPNTTGTSYEIHNDIIDSCTHYYSIKIKNNKVILVGAICYCN